MYYTLKDNRGTQMQVSELKTQIPESYMLPLKDKAVQSIKISKKKSFSMVGGSQNFRPQKILRVIKILTHKTQRDRYNNNLYQEFQISDCMN